MTGVTDTTGARGEAGHGVGWSTLSRCHIASTSTTPSTTPLPGGGRGGKRGGGKRLSASTVAAERFGSDQPRPGRAHAARTRAARVGPECCWLGAECGCLLRRGLVKEVG